MHFLIKNVFTPRNADLRCALVNPYAMVSRMDQVQQSVFHYFFSTYGTLSVFVKRMSLKVVKSPTS